MSTARYLFLLVILLSFPMISAADHQSNHMCMELDPFDTAICPGDDNPGCQTPNFQNCTTAPFTVGQCFPGGAFDWQVISIVGDQCSGVLFRQKFGSRAGPCLGNNRSVTSSSRNCNACPTDDNPYECPPSFSYNPVQCACEPDTECNDNTLITRRFVSGSIGPGGYCDGDCYYRQLGCDSSYTTSTGSLEIRNTYSSCTYRSTGESCAFDGMDDDDDPDNRIDHPDNDRSNDDDIDDCDSLGDNCSDDDPRDDNNNNTCDEGEMCDDTSIDGCDPSIADDCEDYECPSGQDLDGDGICDGDSTPGSPDPCIDVEEPFGVCDGSDSNLCIDSNNDGQCDNCPDENRDLVCDSEPEFSIEEGTPDDEDSDSDSPSTNTATREDTFFSLDLRRFLLPDTVGFLGNFRSCPNDYMIDLSSIAGLGDIPLRWSLLCELAVLLGGIVTATSYVIPLVSLARYL